MNGRAKARMPRSLIITPTRELAAQVAENFEKYAANTKLTMALLIGGVAFGPQEQVLNRGADVLVATPGRLLDQFERGKILLADVQVMVVDEADRMLDMGFIPDIERIFSLVPPRRQTLFFSATMPKEIQRLVERFLNNPERVEVSRPAMAATTVNQLLIRVKDKTPKAKRDALRKAMDRDGVKNGIIFCNRKRDVDVVARALQKHGYSAAPIHGDLDQSTRTATLEKFKTGEVRFLVASDVAARGLDIPAVSHVFNYDMPHHADDYVHRIGRTGRAGLQGEAITLAGPEDGKSLAAVEALIGTKIELLDAKPGDAKPKAADTPAAEPEATTEDNAADETAQPDESTTSDSPRPEGGARRSRRGGRSKSRSRGKSEGDEKRRDEREEISPSSGGGGKILGFGDDVPAFFRNS
jgi:superfamily II DNA/RNA helicase